MEPRVAVLETKMDQVCKEVGDLKNAVAGIDGRLRSVEIGLATLTERVAHLPSKGFIVAATATTLALLTALIVFQGHIQRLLRLG